MFGSLPPGPRNDKMARVRRESGEVASTLIIFLVVITSFFLAVHAMYVHHGNHVVSAAAQDALAAAQQEGATQASATKVGNERLKLFSGLDGSVVVKYLDDDQVEAVATATIKTPFLNINNELRARVQGPIERFYEQNERE